MQWVGNEKRADSSAGNDHQFGGLDKHFEIGVLHQITANYRAEHHQDSNNREHFRYFPEAQIACCPMKAALNRYIRFKTSTTAATNGASSNRAVIKFQN